MLYTGTFTHFNGNNYVYVSSAPFDSDWDTFESNSFLVLIPKNSVGTENIVANVLYAGGASLQRE